MAGRVVPENIKIADVFDIVETGSFDCGPPISNSLREHCLLDENDDTQVPLIDNKEMDQDITTLPETVLVKIMDYLELHDKYSLSLTCKRLNYLFYHPSLWKFLELKLTGGYCSSTIFTDFYENIVFDPSTLNKHFKIVEIFGKYIQHVKIKTLGYFLEFPQELPLFLTTVAKKCRLQSLTVKATGLVPNVFKLEQYGVSAARYLIPFVNLVKSAKQLRSFSLISWPTRMDDCIIQVDILRSLLDNEEIRHLSDLKLFWIDEADGSVERNQEFPTPEQTVTIVKHFEYLTHLSLRLQMISDELLVEMASSRRSRFQKLKILIIHSSQTRKHRFPVLSPESWRMLTDHCPQFRVSIVIMNRVKSMDLDVVLTASIPLESVIFLEHSRIDEDILSFIGERYNNTLIKFESYCHSVSCDIALLNMIEQCTNVTNLVYFGQVHHSTIIKLAKLRGNKWWTFRFLASMIEIQEKDTDSVLGTGQNGELFLVSLLEFHEDLDQRMAVLACLDVDVSEIIGYKWKLSLERGWKPLVKSHDFSMYDDF